MPASIRLCPPPPFHTSTNIHTHSENSHQNTETTADRPGSILSFAKMSFLGGLLGDKADNMVDQAVDSAGEERGDLMVVVGKREERELTVQWRLASFHTVSPRCQKFPCTS